MQLSKIKTDFVSIFDTNDDRKIEFYELSPLFLIVAVMLFFFIVLTNLNILIIFKQSKMFIVLFLVLVLYSLLSIIDYNNRFNKKNKPTIDDNFHYILMFILLFFSMFSLIYLFSIFF